MFLLKSVQLILMAFFSFFQLFLLHLQLLVELLRLGQHVLQTLASGRDYEDVPPSKGVYSGTGSAALAVEVAFTRLA